MNKQKKQEILFVNLGYIGDVIVTFAAIDSIKETFPNSNITILGIPRTKDVYSLCPNIDKSIIYDANSKKPYIEILKFLPKILFKKYDYIFVHISNRNVNLVLALQKFIYSSEIIGYEKNNLSKVLYTKLVPFPKTGIYESEFAQMQVKKINKNSQTRLQKAIIPEEYINKAKSIINKKNKPVIVIHPGCSKTARHKVWAKENWVNLIIKLVESNMFKIVFCGGPEDEEILNEINTSFSAEKYDENNFLNLCGKTPEIADITAIIKVSDALVCLDSAPMHMAVATGTKVFVLAGPTNDVIYMLPNNPDFVAISRTDLDCRPCLYKINQTRGKDCGNYECMNISPDTVFEKIINSFSIKQTTD